MNKYFIITLCKKINYQIHLKSNFDFVNYLDIVASLQTQTILGLSKPESAHAKFQQTTKQTADKKAVHRIIQANGIFSLLQTQAA